MGYQAEAKIVYGISFDDFRLSDEYKDVDEMLEKIVGSYKLVGFTFIEGADITIFYSKENAIVESDWEAKEFDPSVLAVKPDPLFDKLIESFGTNKRPSWLLIADYR